jgi:RNA polymerase sigma-70 factor (sigma-E family)
VNVGGDHALTSTYANAAGAAPRVAPAGAREGLQGTVDHGVVDHGVVDHGVVDHGVVDHGVVDHSVRAVPMTDSGNGEAGHAVALPRTPDQRQSDDDARQHPLVPSARSVDSDDLADRAAGIDDTTFRDYVRSRSGALLRTAYLLTGNRADAEDLVQSALAKTYVAWDRIEDRGALDGYVRRAMVNTQISWWRRRRLEEYPTDEIPDRAVVDQSVSSDMRESLRRAIDRLPQRMRATVMLRYYEDMTEAEVAEALGVSLGTVKSTVSRAMAKLRIDAELQPE